MKRKHLHYAGLALAALVPAAAFFWSSGPLRADEYRKLAYGLSNSLKPMGLNRLAISDFLARGELPPEEAAYAQRQLSEALFEEPGIGIMDVSVLKKISGRGQLWPHVLIKGEVYPTETGLAVVVKVLNFRTGGLIRTMQIETGGIKEAGRRSAAFRDVVSGEKSQACVRLLRQVREENRTGVELKARYWAAKVREPDFSYSELDHVPGGEFTDYRTRQKFYELINAYYEQDRPVILTEQELAGVAALHAREAAAREACRPRRATEASRD